MSLLLLTTAGGPLVLTAAAAGGTQPLLTAADFTFHSWYTYDNSLAEGVAYKGQLTHRYVAGELRFLVPTLNLGACDLVEFRLPDGSEAIGTWQGQIRATEKTHTWVGTEVWPMFPSNALEGHHFGLDWEDLGGGNGRLWTAMGIDYAQTEDEKHITRALSVRTLNADNTVSDFAGPWGFEGVSQRCVYGGVLTNPAWFQAAYGVGPKSAGFGGYASLMAQAGTVSLGLFWASFPDLAAGGYPAGALPYKTGGAADWNVPATDFAILADYRTALDHGDWDPADPPGWDRGQRLTPVVNWYNATNQPPNGVWTDAEVETYYETTVPGAGSGWLNPAGDGRNRWVWGDTPFATTCWIDGPAKQGIVQVLSLTTGWAGYVNSALSGGGGGAELQVYDPHHLGEVKLGTRQPWQVQPVAFKDLVPDVATLGVAQGWAGYENGFQLAARGAEFGGPVGATFDPTTKKLWVVFTAVNGVGENALVCYDVNC